jgi:hypothetical protein
VASKLPKYVRLRSDLRGRYDTFSGFSVTGLDVKEVPDEETHPNTCAFIRAELSAGRLEGASKAEYDEAHPDLGGDVVPTDSAPVQERAIRTAAAEVNAKIRNRRATGEEMTAHEADEARRKAVLKVQDARAKGGKRSAAEDDDEEEALRLHNEQLAREQELRATGASGGADPDDDDEDDDTDDEYDAMKKDELKAEADKRGLPTSGTAQELRAALRAHDESQD